MEPTEAEGTGETTQEGAPASPATLDGAPTPGRLGLAVSRARQRPLMMTIAGLLLVAGLALVITDRAEQPDLRVGDRGTHRAADVGGCFELTVGHVLYRTTGELPATWTARREVEGDLEVTDRLGPDAVAGFLKGLGALRVWGREPSVKLP